MFVFLSTYVSLDHEPALVIQEFNIVASFPEQRSPPTGPHVTVTAVTG